MADNLPAISKVGDLVNARTQLLCTWGSPLATLGWILGWMVLTGFIPPLDPAASAEEIAAIYTSRPNMICAGLCVCMIGSVLIGPFFAAISQQMKRIEGRYSPLADTQLGLGMLVIMMFIIPCWALGTAAFRPERAPQLILLMNDFGWLPFVGGFQMTFFQLLAIAICIFQDDQQRVFPRWVGYFNVWIALLCLPAAFVLFFKHGPFAWNGLMAFWFLVVVFVGWFLVMFFVVRKAIRGQEAESIARQA